MSKEKAEQITMFLLRVVSGGVFLQYGGIKLFGWFGGLPGGMHIRLMSLLGLAGALELFGGLLVTIGLFTRPVAFILSGEMAVAYFMGPAPHGISPAQNMGAPAVLFCFIFLFFAAHGAGPWGVDALFKRKPADPN